MKLTRVRIFLFVLLFLPFTSFLQAQTSLVPWLSVGPDGGDARSFAFDPANPSHLYLGTTNSWLYQSSDGGASWHRLARIGKDDDFVVDNIEVDSSDPKTLFAGVWVLDHNGGGIYISHDSGVSWSSISDMDGQSVRALAQSPSNAKVLIAGTLSGVYRSEDRGEHWKLISPSGSSEIHEVESIAIDPSDSRIVYAGTWHLPWKTTDGGANWQSIKQGVIDDSDVFSIIIDPSRPSVVYASACSGIYRSDNGGNLFRKVQGIPSTARRTRVLLRDPVNRDIVYAGTTEGLYKTMNGGSGWTRTTGPDLIINDVYVDPKNPQHVLLATDRSGVLVSQDAGATFASSNSGFSQRQVASLLIDSKQAGKLYAGVVNDKSYGGVFVSEDSGKTWKQQSNGLDGRDVFDLAETSDGVIVAGTSHGIFRFDGSAWTIDGLVVNQTEKTEYVTVRGKKGKKASKIKRTVMESSKPVTIDGRVSKLSVSGNIWYAATSDGIYRSVNQGSSWEGPVEVAKDYLFVAASGTVVFAARRQDLTLSEDNGRTWQPVGLPKQLSDVRALTTSPNGTLWVGGLQGVFYSDDKAQSWRQIERMPIAGINSLRYDAELGRVIVTSRSATLVLGVNVDDKSWKWWDTGWTVHSVQSLGGRLIGASLYDGVVMQPGSPSTGLRRWGVQQPSGAANEAQK